MLSPLIVAAPAEPLEVKLTILQLDRLNQVEGRVSTRGLLLLSLFILLTVSLGISQSGCTVDVPIDAVVAPGGVVRDLRVSDLAAENIKKQNLKIESLTYDVNARRILFVLDTVHDLPSDARKAEARIVQQILGSARPVDTFALMTARGTARSVKFDQGKDAVKGAAHELASDPKEKENGLGVLDAVAEGMEWFGAPQPGDSIFVMAMNLEGNHKTTAKKISDELERRHIRLFGVALGPVNLGSTVATQSDNYRGKFSYAQAGDMPDYRDQDFYPLTLNSGGFLYGDNALNEQREYKLTDDHLQKLQGMAIQFHQVMAEYFHLQIALPSNSEAWKLSLSGSGQERLSKTVLLYPRQISCPR